MGIRKKNDFRQILLKKRLILIFPGIYPKSANGLSHSQKNKNYEPRTRFLGTSLHLETAYAVCSSFCCGYFLNFVVGIILEIAKRQNIPKILSVISMEFKFQKKSTVFFGFGYPLLACFYCTTGIYYVKFFTAI